MAQRGVHLRQAGVVSALGRGVTALTEGLAAPPPTPEQFVIDELANPLSIPYLRAPIDTADAPRRNLALTETAVGDALDGIASDERADMMIFIASSSVDLCGQEPGYAAALKRGDAGIAFREPRSGDLAAWIAKRFGVYGAQYTINTACSSGANALLYAASAIERGACRQALVVGLEIPSRVTLAGFHALMLLSRDGCRPFDAQRDGIVLGESVCAVVLGGDDTHGPLSRFCLRGGASACDTGSPTHTSAESVARVMQDAVADVDDPQPVAIKAHGTGTASNDAAEARGIAMAGDLGALPITALKPNLGHTLGACGVLETLAVAGCWEQGWLPACHGLRTPDPELPLAPRTEPFEIGAGDIVLSYFGFGGNNCALVLGRQP